MFSKQRQRDGSRAKRIAGFTTLEMLAALIVGTALIAAGGHMYGKYQDNVANQSVADHARMVAKAVKLYIHDHQSQLINQINGPSNTRSMTFESIQQQGYGKGLTPTNVFGQAYTVGIRKNVLPGNNQVSLDTLIVASGGNHSVSDGHLLSIAQKIGAEGGAIRHGAPNNVQGAFRGWEATPSAYGITNAAAGSVAVGLFVVSNGANGGGGNQNDDVLHRVKVTGKPELNEMATPIGIISGNTLGLQNYEGNSDPNYCNNNTRVGTLITTIDGTLLSCRNGRWLKASEGQWKDSKQSYDWLRGWVTSGNQVGDVRVAHDGDGVTHTPRAYVWHQIGVTPGSWLPLSIDQNGDMQVPRNLVVGSTIKLARTAAATCDPAQANLAVNTAGNVVVCKNGTWAEVKTN